MLKSCSEKAFCCQVEVCLTKHKWDCLGNPEDDEAKTSDAQSRKEEEEDNMRLQQLADELAAESRMTFDDKTNTMNLNRKKVTDFRRNSRVVLPKAQSGIKERFSGESLTRATGTG